MAGIDIMGNLLSECTGKFTMIVAQRRLSHLTFTRDTTMDLFCSKPRSASWTGSQNHLPSQWFPMVGCAVTGRMTTIGGSENHVTDQCAPVAIELIKYRAEDYCQKERSLCRVNNMVMILLNVSFFDSVVSVLY
ncbi:hypothetical protein T09_3394 [Trichinella sp. T9]|nr:hypothetical protein T09_3394 [Trichinella sp. T9]